MSVGRKIKCLFEHLKDNDYIVPLDGCNRDLMKFQSREILRELRRGDGRWAEGVPDIVHDLIVEQRLFGYDSEEEAVLVRS